MDSQLESLGIFYEWVVNWLLTADLIAQCVAIVLCYVTAKAIGRYVRRRVRLADEEKYTRHFKRYYYRTIRRVASPVSLIVLLAISGLAFKLTDHPTRILDKAIELAVAWLIIRLLFSQVNNPAVSRVLSTLIWLIAALSITGYLELVIAWLDDIKLDNADNGLTIYDLITSALSVAGFVWGALALSELLDRALQSKFGLSPSVQALLSKLFKFTLLGVAALIGLSVVGIDLTAFAVFGGAIAVGIGLGLQKVFSNLIAGIILLSDNSIKPGDTIVSEGRYGKVNKLSARYISIITRDGTEHLIPNDELINNRVENWSHSDENVRLKCPISVHYQTDIHRAIELCIEAANDTPRVLGFPKPVCLLKGFGDNGMQLELRFWVNDPMNGCSNVKSQVLLKVWDKFHENGIEIPYPQRDIHVRSVDSHATLTDALARTGQ